MDQFRKLVDDSAYLQDEVEALKYVISSVPYDEKPAGKHSILEMVALIDHAQQNYFRVALKQLLSDHPDGSGLQEDFRKTYDTSEVNGKGVDRVLDKIIKHRAAIVSMLAKTTEIDLQRTMNVRGRKKGITDFLEEMVQFERLQLKQVAERVLTISERK
jgi:hypothetical protein